MNLRLLAALSIAVPVLAACAVDPNAPARDVYRPASTTGTRLPQRDDSKVGTMSEQELRDMARSAGKTGTSN